MPSPGMAGAEAAEGEPATLEGAVLADSLEAVGAAGGGKAAFGPEKRRYGTLVKADDADEQYGEQFFHSGVAGAIMAASLPMPFIMAASTGTYSGSSLSVKIRNICSCMPGGTAA